MKSKLALALLGTLLASNGFAHGFQHDPVKANLSLASSIAQNVVGNIQAELARIEAGQPASTSGACEFCADEDSVDENDKLVSQHLLVLSAQSARIADFAAQAAVLPPPARDVPAAQACNLTKDSLRELPNGKAAVAFAQVGVASTQVFDNTQLALQQIKGLIPNCF